MLTEGVTLEPRLAEKIESEMQQKIVGELLPRKRESNHGVLVLDLGGGGNGRKEWVNIDRHPKADICHDLEETPLPLPDNEFDCINASHVLEHIWCLVPLLNDLWRIVKPNGVLLVRVPNYKSAAAIVDPTHVRMFHPDTIGYFTKQWPYYDRGDSVKDWSVNKRMISDAEIIWAMQPVKEGRDNLDLPQALPDGAVTPQHFEGDKPYIVTRDLQK